MRRTGEDQSIILSGITGSGKSTTRSHLLNQILLLSTHSKKETKLQQQIQNSLVILEAFGHTKTLQTSSASKYGMFQELQFSERGRILGAKTLTYAFDKSRITFVPKEERSFNVFYSLLAGTSQEEQIALHINFPPESFNYLAQSKTIKVPEINDEIAFADLKSSLKVCGFKAKTVTQIFQLLAAILHIGNLQFQDDNDAGNQAQEACCIRNHDVLEVVAAILGVSPTKLEQSLTYKLRLIRKELCTMFLNTQGATEQRDALARALYHVLFLWIVETLNTKICYNDGEPANFVGILDQFGFQNFKSNGFEEFCANFANERVNQFIIDQRFSDTEGMGGAMMRDGVPLPKIITMDNSACLELLIGKEQDTQKNVNKSAALGLGGIVGAMDRDCAKYQTGATDATNANFLANVQRTYGSHPSFSKSGHAYSFGINHFSGCVHYTVDSFLEKNLDDLSPDFVSLLRENSTNTFVSNLFESSAMATESHPKDDRTIVKAQLTSKPTRAPSMKRPNKRRGNNVRDPAIPEGGEPDADEMRKQKLIHDAEDAYQNMQVTTVMDQLYMTLRDLFYTMSDTRIYNIIHIRPNDTQSPDVFDPKRVKAQVRAFLLPDLTFRSAVDYANYYTFGEFLMRYENFVNSLQIDHTKPEREQVENVRAIMNWVEPQAFIGHDMIWFSYETWKELEDGLRAAEKEERDRAKGLEAKQELPHHIDQHMAANAAAAAAAAVPVGHYQDGRLLPPNPVYMGNMGQGGHFEDGASYMDSDDGMKRDMEGSQWGEESEWGMKGLSDGFGPNMDMSKMVEDYHTPQNESVEEMPITAVRIWWIRFVWLMTWWIPSPFLSWFGKMKREDVQMAWREKVTLCIIIFFFSAITIFVIVGLGEVICPGTRNMFSGANVQAHGTPDDMYVSVRGHVYDITNFAKSQHGASAYIGTPDLMSQVAGLDVSYSVPPPLTVACAGLVNSANIKIIPNNTIVLANFVHNSGDQRTVPTLPKLADPRWYWDYFIPTMTLYRKGKVVVPINQLYADYQSWSRLALAINGKVYDINDYMSTSKIFDSGSTATDYHFLNPTVEEIFTKFSGTDATDKWNQYRGSMTLEEQEMNLNCLNNFFYIGDVDERDSARCMFTNYMLLTAAVLMCFVIVVKFLAALQFGGAPTPEDHDKFVICQVPCYTEDEESLKKTIDSLTVMNYDDKRKLLYIIADGMIMGSGNDRPTPRIVLDVLGYDTKNDPEPLMFKSIGEGSKQLNYGKVYSGLYECEGHVVPYVVIVKVGKASERAKPGNRGKRDSQMICMNFLNKVHFDSEMTPLELEMYHQIKNVIGVNPSFYEYILMVDSDTEVMADALNHMISRMLHDGRIIGLCGETKLVNEDRSWTTMIQVYEYYISHHLAKAFESLFGSVTCLPGCFCMYRIRTPVKNEPLIISPKVIYDYSDNHVDTLHKKNLLHLGEDRYLTTLMMKHFPQYKMKFTAHAQCKTVAPDRWQILLSQRRRWINSTIHNLFEVVLLPDLCGFCCFSMRFVVLIDLIGTLTLPVSVIYLVYLIYVIASKSGPIPILALCMLAGIYGLQAILFILKRQWQHIGWMIFYILAIPVFSFFLPIYSFWHFDDFSWGNTRVVVGDKKQKKIIVADDEKFDEKMIPLKKWSVYEQELWELGSTGSKETGVTGNTYKSYQTHGSRNNQSAMYDSRTQYGGSQAGGEYDYYRDTNVAGYEKRGGNRAQSPMGFTGSVIGGSEYGGAATQDFMMTPPMPRGSQAMSVHSFGPDYATSGHITPMMGGGNGSMMYDRSSAMMGGSMMGAQPHMMIPGANQSEYEMPMRPMSQFSIPLSQGGMQPMTPPGFPTDEEILSEIRNILQTANLMSITKKQVREQLSAFFGFDMTPKKEYINTSIEYILQGRL
ncbi:chitin synthase [Mucor mucedo]|uniref:chitin synthase n=1 Tax=Mucor mucedo TaxID=29922 RepID=UPI0022206AAD|nr:chitin synthase [Mucor mucedo]KAI7889478.1 chitin synthase [Mucor mucedo]